MNDQVLKEINNFLRTRKGNLGGFDGFRKTGLYEHHGNLFGHLIYTEDTSVNYIGVDASGTLYDEMYYPYENFKKVGTIVPKHLFEQDGIDHSIKPDPIWKDVAEKGYGIIDSIVLPENLQKECLNEGFLPHGHKEELNLPKSIHSVYFDPLIDLVPERQVTREYLQACTAHFLKYIPTPQPLISRWALHTADIKKYVFDPNDFESDKGAYSFHMDYFARCLFMFFSYLTKEPEVVGRELLIGKREDFLDFSSEAVDLSPAEQPKIESPFARLPDSRVPSFDRIPIKSHKVILMNTFNPMVVHRVEKLKAPNEVILLANYIWCKERKFTD